MAHATKRIVSRVGSCHHTTKRGKTMTDDTYNGWTNRETWALMLHLGNDQYLDEESRRIVEEAEYPRTDISAWVESLLDPREYRYEFGEDQPEGIQMMASEVGSLWRVNWDEVVKSLKDE